MYRKFDKAAYRWDGVEPHEYKENHEVFRHVTKQVLFENEGICRCSSGIFRWSPADGRPLSITSTCIWW